MGRNLVIILIVLVSVLLAGAGYLVFQNQQLIGKLTKQTTSPSPATTEPPTPPQLSPTQSPSLIFTLALTQNAIKTNINAKNYQELTAYMTNPVSVILQASECCGPKTPAEAIDQMSYINPGIPFDFDQESATTKNLKDKNPQLADKFIGISKSSEYLIAFAVNNENKISELLMSVSWKLFSY